jgi:hypothetical protein
MQEHDEFQIEPDGYDVGAEQTQDEDYEKEMVLGSNLEK